MPDRSEIILRKLSSLFKTNSAFDDRHWPAYVLTTLETKYQLSPKEMLRLWYIRRGISKGDHPVDSLLIYDRVKASERRILVRSYTDLYSNSDLLLFKGTIFGNGSVHLERVND